MADKIRVGIVGASVTQAGSGWGRNAHVPALRALPEYELWAVCTAHEDTAKASAAAFGAPLAFHDFDAMIAHPEIDLVAVSVRVPGHRELVLKALQAGKTTFCEWPLGRNLAEAEEMAALARERRLRTIVGLQGRSDPAIMYARDQLAKGEIGEVLAANLSVSGGAQLQRGPDRIWQAEHAAGANTLTISGGHAIDALCYVLGEFAELSARVDTRIREWTLTDGGTVKVDAPDYFSVSGRLTSGAEVTVQVAAVPAGATGHRLEIYGREGMLLMTTGGSPNVGPNELYGARGRDRPAPLPIPEAYKLAPEGTPAGQPFNVAQAYTRFADARDGGDGFDPDFDLAVLRHRLLDAIERSSREGRSVKLP